MMILNVKINFVYETLFASYQKTRGKGSRSLFPMDTTPRRIWNFFSFTHSAYQNKWFSEETQFVPFHMYYIKHLILPFR